jgi:hypothetical protein
MAGKDNLVPIRTTEEARERGKNGGKKSGEARRNKKMLRECLEALLEGEVEYNGSKVSISEAMAATAVQAALRGDWKAWELVRDTAGQKPVEKVVTADVDPSVIDEVEEMVRGSRDDTTRGG